MSSKVYDGVRPSKAPGKTIRVLELDKGGPGDPLEGSLVLCPLEGDGPLPGYTALSYTWGQRTAEDTTIQPQGDTAPVEVWTELKHAPNGLRERDKSVGLDVRASVHVWRQARHLMPLQYTWRRRTEGLPTWCPDW